MSVFTNPASGSIENARAYAEAILGLLGATSPLEVLPLTGDALRGCVARMSDREMAMPETDGKWSVRQVLRHLADSEIVWSWRLRLVLAQDRPPLTGYDQDAWADRLGYAQADPRESLEEFTVLRRANLRLLEGATAAQLERAGMHAERGDESLAQMMRLYAGHDLLHIRQIERIRAAVTGVS